MSFLETALDVDWLVLLTRICVGPRPSTVSRTGKLRYGRASLELTGRRMSASPCWLSLAHPKRVTEGEDEKKEKEEEERS